MKAVGKKKTAATRVPPTHATTKTTPARKINPSTKGLRKRVPKYYRVGVTSAIAKRSAKRWGGPQDRLRARLELEAERSDVTPLRIDEKLLRLRDAAALIGVSSHTLRRWALDDKVVYRRVGALMLMIPESEVERLRSYGN